VIASRVDQALPDQDEAILDFSLWTPVELAGSTLECDIFADICEIRPAA